MFHIKPQSKVKGLGSAKYDTYPNPSKVSIWEWNVNGISAVINKGLFQSFITKANPDILILNEIKLDELKIPSMDFVKHIPSDYE